MRRLMERYLHAWYDVKPQKEKQAYAIICISMTIGLILAIIAAAMFEEYKILIMLQIIFVSAHCMSFFALSLSKCCNFKKSRFPVLNKCLLVACSLAAVFSVILVISKQVDFDMIVIALVWALATVYFIIRIYNDYQSEKN